MGLELKSVFGRARLLAVILIILIAILPSALVVRAQDSEDEDYLQERLANDEVLNDARSELSDTQDAISALADRLGVLELSNEEIQAEINRLELELQRQRERLSGILATQVVIAKELEAATAAFQKAEGELVTQRQILTNRLVSMYVFTEGSGGHLPFDVASAAELGEQRVLMEMIGEHDRALVENYLQASRAARKLSEEFDAANAHYERIAASVQAQIQTVTEQEESQRILQEELERRIEGLHAEIHALEDAQAEVEAILAQRRSVIKLEAAERDRLRAICFSNPRSPLDSDGTWVDCDAVGVSIPPIAFRWPLSTRVTSEYGPRWGRMHEGIDQNGSVGDPIAAAEGGYVDYAGWIRGYGNTVIISHGGGATTLYAHLSDFAVSAQSTVRIGQTIGYVGNTGRSFGPHLHFEIRFNGIPVNPRGYLP